MLPGDRGLFLGLQEFDENVAILSFLSMMRKAYFNWHKEKKNLPVLKTMRSSMTGQQDDSLGKVGGRGAEHRKIPPQWRAVLVNPGWAIHSKLRTWG